MTSLMPKTKRRRRNRTEGKPELDVVTQLQCAWRNPGAAALGAAIGGIVPWFAREIAHRELPAAWAAGNRWLTGAELIVIAGCALFSVLTVYKFGRAAFGSDARKAAGFCAALEGVMLVTSGAIGLVAILVLVAINAIVNGCSIALAHEATMRRRSDDARRQATRAKTEATKREARTSTSSQARAETAHVPAAVHAPVAIRAPVAWSRRRRHEDAIDADAVYS